MIQQQNPFMKFYYPSLIILMISGCNQHTPQVFTTIPERDLVVEGIAYHSGSKTFYVGSINKRKIVKIQPDGSVSDFNSGSFEILGMMADKSFLWACGNSSLQDSIVISVLLKYDITTGALLKQYELRDSVRHLFNDLVLTKSHVYITDSDHATLYQVEKETEQLTEFMKGDDLNSCNGITASPDERYLIVSTRRGLLRIEMASRKKLLLQHPHYYCIGLDGIYFYNQSIIGIQNVQYPEFINQYELNDSLTRITEINTLLFGGSNVKIPTTGTIVGNNLFIIANSQLEHWDAANSTFIDTKTLTEPKIIKVSIPTVTMQATKQ
jgi:hypothetical protein